MASVYASVLDARGAGATTEGAAEERDEADDGMEVDAAVLHSLARCEPSDDDFGDEFDDLILSLEEGAAVPPADSAVVASAPAAPACAPASAICPILERGAYSLRLVADERARELELRFQAEEAALEGRWTGLLDPRRPALAAGAGDCHTEDAHGGRGAGGTDRGGGGQVAMAAVEEQLAAAPESLLAAGDAAADGPDAHLAEFTGGAESLLAALPFSAEMNATLAAALQAVVEEAQGS